MPSSRALALHPHMQAAVFSLKVLRCHYLEAVAALAVVLLLLVVTVVFAVAAYMHQVEEISVVPQEWCKWRRATAAEAAPLP